MPNGAARKTWTMMKDPAARAHMQEIARLAISFDPIYYELRESHAAEKAQ